MNKQAIERIKGYCCEVNQEQWEELVSVADEVGCNVGPASRRDGPCGRYELAEYDCAISLCRRETANDIIPFPDFLAKLRGEEQWQPKAGEMVEVGGGYVREYISKRGEKHYCWGECGDIVSTWPSVKQLRPTITRAEAEQQLGKRIID